MSETTRTLPEWVREPWRLRAGALGAARWLRGNPKRTLLTGAGAAIFVFAAASALRSRTSDAMLLAAVEEGPFEVQIVESGLADFSKYQDHVGIRCQKIDGCFYETVAH